MKYNILNLTVEEMQFVLKVLDERGVSYPPGSHVAEMIRSIQEKVNESY